MMHQRFFLFVFLLTSVRGQKEGESCVDNYVNTIGRCTVLDACESARQTFTLSRIEPTFCSYNTFGDRIVCCRDGSNILNSASNRPQDDRPLRGNAEQLNDSRRISERKCEEYSRSVVKSVGYIPLIPNPESFTVSEANCEYTGLELVVGGENAKTGEFPHMAAIGWANFGKYKFNCGGTLISPLYVVTAAHCSRDSSAETPEPVIVRLGDQNIDNSVNDGANPIDVAIRRMIQHPNYHSPKVYDDIALLELVAEVKFNSAIRPACLWTKPDLTRYRNVIATGWGKINRRDKDISTELQKVSLKLLDVGFCNESWRHLLNRHFHNGFKDSQMCAGELRGGKDTCQGDSGTPIQVVSRENSCIFHIVGVTSIGKNCGDAGRPAVYTRIWSYLDWIESIVWPGQ